MTILSLQRNTFLGGGLFVLSACIPVLESEMPEENLAITKEVQTDPMGERPPATAAEAAVLFRAVCLDQAPDFERSSQVLNQMPEIEINAESGYQHINLNVSFSLEGGVGNKRCTMTFNSDDSPELVEAELNEVLNIPGIISSFSPPPRRRGLNIFSISVQADPNAAPQTEAHPEAPAEAPSN